MQNLTFFSPNFPILIKKTQFHVDKNCQIEVVSKVQFSHSTILVNGC